MGQTRSGSLQTLSMTMLTISLMGYGNAVAESPGNPNTAADETTVVAEGAKLELVADGFKFTEGPAVDAEGVVYFTDQPNDRILRCDLDESVTTWLQPAGRSNGLFFSKPNTLIACADGNNELWAIDVASKSHKVLLSGFEDKRFNGPNDAWADADGTIYFTDPYYKRPYWQHSDTTPKLPRQVYRYSPASGNVEITASDFKQPNGIVGDANSRTIYVADIGDKKTYRFKISDSGNLEERKLFCEMGSDGMTLDSQGNLYLTGKGVTVFNDKGKQIDHIDVPEGWTANVCIGGRSMNRLYITASDSLYRVQLKYTGLAAPKH